MSEHDDDRAVNRRTFLLELAAIGLTGSVLSSCAGAGPSASGRAAARPDRIGVQLYTVRDLLQKDFEGTLEQVAQIGYTQVEFAGYYNRTPEQVRAILDRLKLTSPSVHAGAALLRNDLAGQIRSAKVLGQQYITLPSYPFPRDGGLPMWQAAAVEWNRWGAACRAEGLKLAFHNHANEFAPVVGGPTGFDVLVRETDPALVDFELDIYWAAFADQDPLALMAKYPGRFSMWHVKDLIPAAAAAATSPAPATGTTGDAVPRGPGKRSAPVGQGVLDFKRMFDRAQQSGLRYFFVEDDTAAQYGGSLNSIRASHDFLRRLLA